MPEGKVDIAKIVKCIWRIFLCDEYLTNTRKLYSGVDEVWLALSPQTIKYEHQQGPQLKIPNVLGYVPF
jgi:hypothetical protein